MTKSQLKAHLKDKKAKCPFCGSADIVDEGFEISVSKKGPLAIQLVQCTTCGRSWVDEYQLVNAFEV